MAESLKAGDSLEAAAYEAGDLNTNIVLKRRLQRFAEDELILTLQRSLARHSR